MKERNTLDSGFSRFAGRTADLAGSPWAFAIAMASIALWASAGPTFHFSDAWQLVMNSWTNFVTFAMVFLIQHAQNRDSKAINLKLNEIVRALPPAQDELIDIEVLSNEELAHLEKRYQEIRNALEARRNK